MAGKIINPLAAVVLLILLGIFVALLNGFALFVLFMKKRTKLANIPILWILAANMLIGCFPLPIYGLKKYGSDDNLVAGKICDAWRYTYFLCIHLALVSLFIMTVEKIFVLVFVLRYKEMLNTFRLNFVFVVCWLFFIIFDMIPFFPVNEVDDEYCHYVVKKDWALAMNILTMAIPLPLIVCCYGYMVYLAYVQTIRIHRNSTAGARKYKNKFRMAIEVKATRTVAFIVGAYIFCWTPATLYYLLVWLCPHCYPKNYQPHKTWIRFFFKLLNLFHAFLTPIIFCVRSKEFRKDTKKILGLKTGESCSPTTMNQPNLSRNVTTECIVTNGIKNGVFHHPRIQ